MSVDFDQLFEKMSQHSALGPNSLHGPDHWARVERNGIQIASRNGADETVIRLFAIFHDAERRSDGYDPEHGQRAAALVADLHGDMFTIDENSFSLLYTACELHHEGEVSDDVTIGTCWDADRLDLTRVFKTPDPKFLSTDVGKMFSESGHFNDAD